MTTYDVLASVTEDDADELWPVYDAVFADQTDSAGWRAGVWDRHVARAGFDWPGPTTARRWWGSPTATPASAVSGGPTRRPRCSIPRSPRSWLGGHFELVSIGVVEAGRGSGVGTALLRAVTDGLPHRSVGC